jgi:hypothetical protein
MAAKNAGRKRNLISGNEIEESADLDFSNFG